MKPTAHLRSLKPGMAEKLGNYVYLYVDPRDGKVFYDEKVKIDSPAESLFAE